MDISNEDVEAAKIGFFSRGLALSTSGKEQESAAFFFGLGTKKNVEQVHTISMHHGDGLERHIKV